MVAADGNEVSVYEGLSEIAGDGGCSATTKSGKPCKAAAVSGTRFCALHGDPTRAASLGRMGGRKNRHYVDTHEVTFEAPSTPQDVVKILAQAMVDLRAKRLDPRIASALTHMSGALLKALETSDVESRLARLEELFVDSKGK